MKTKKSLASLVFGIATLISAVSAQGALTIGFSPVNQTVPLGSNPQVNIIATLDGTVGGLGGWDLILTYDASIITFSSASFGTALGNSLKFGSSSSGQAGLIEVSLDNPLPAQPASFTLATLTFSADDFGTSSLNLRLGQGGLTTGLAQPITGAILNSGSITVRRPSQGVPEGGNLAIVALPTLVGLLFLSKRKQNSKH